AAALTQAGPGLLRLTGTNSFTGPININQGTLAYGTTASLNNLPVTLTGGNLGPLTDGDGTGTVETINMGGFGVTIAADSGFTVDRIGATVPFTAAANKRV